jgi:hypothetical protein
MTSPRSEESDARSPWDQDEADWLIGKQVVVGITRLAADGKTVKAQSQYHGKIVAADEADGFEIECEGAWAGRRMILPSDLSAFRFLDDGENAPWPRCKGVENLEIVSNWTFVEPSNS